MISNYFLLWNLGDVVTGSSAQISVPVQALTDLQGTVATTCLLFLLPPSPFPSLSLILPLICWHLLHRHTQTTLIVTALFQNPCFWPYLPFCYHSLATEWHCCVKEKSLSGPTLVASSSDVSFLCLQIWFNVCLKSFLPLCFVG